MKDLNCNENYSHYYLDSDNNYHSTSSYECPESYKLIKEKNLCIINCSDDTEYKYEFNNTCYKEYPFISDSLEYTDNLTQFESDIYNMTESIVDNTEIPEGYYLKNDMLEECDEKCKKCSFESVFHNNLCISCNIDKGYYPIFTDYGYNNSFINCFNETPFGYYFINNTYKLDKKCDIFEKLVNN